MFRKNGMSKYSIASSINISKQRIAQIPRIRKKLIRVISVIRGLLSIKIVFTTKSLMEHPENREFTENHKEYLEKKF